MKKTKRRAQRLTFAERKTMLTDLLHQHWTEASSKKSRTKLLTHMIDVTVSLLALETGFHPAAFAFIDEQTVDLLRAIDRHAKETNMGTSHVIEALMSVIAPPAELSN